MMSLGEYMFQTHQFDCSLHVPPLKRNRPPYEEGRLKEYQLSA